MGEFSRQQNLQVQAQPVHDLLCCARAAHNSTNTPEAGGGDQAMRVESQRALLIGCLVLLLAACGSTPAAPTATTDYDRNYDFSRVRKLAIQPIPRDTLETMTISDGQISRVNQALSTELTRRGFQVVTKNVDADIFLSWKFVPRESAEVATSDPGKQQIAQGMMYVTLIDPIMLQSVWRASFQSDLRDQLENAEAAQYRQSVAQAVLAQFPPDAVSH
jgi:hypothetical protein